MMRIDLRQQLVVGLTSSVLAFVVAGCQSSAVAQRRAQRPAAYQSMDAATQRLVNKGRIQNGMDTNAVFIAWGQPTDAFTVNLPGGGQRMIWNYEEKWAYEFRRRTPVPGYATSTAGYADTPAMAEMRPTEHYRVPITYVARSATFSDGKVIEWKKFAPPASGQPTDVSPLTGRRY